MNFTQFMEQVDTGAAEMPRQMLEKWIHELARTLPEDGRERFLDIMHTVGGHSPVPQSDDFSDSLASEIQEVTRSLERIQAGDLCLDSEYNEEWDDWYNSDADEVLFSDPDKLLADIESGIGLVHKCIDREEYGLGWGVAERLSTLEVSVTGDYVDYEGASMGLSDLYRYALLDGSEEDYAKEAFLLAYLGNELPDRAERMFRVMDCLQCPGVKLEDIMGLGSRDLPELREFLPLWVRYLGNQTGWIAEDLLEEALELLDDDELILDTARCHVDQHPQIYQQILKNGLACGENDRLYHIGMEALEKIPAEQSIRGEIALLTARYARGREDVGAVEACWLEAFRSDPSVVNYMRLRLGAEDYSQYKDRVAEICGEARMRTKNMAWSTSWESVGEIGWKPMTDAVYDTILFWEEDFNSVWERGMQAKQPLGWSASFTKEGLALFLLLLFRGEKLPQGLTSMLGRAVSSCAFHGEAYCNGAGMEEPQGDAELFWKLFCTWKAGVSVPEEQADQWLKQIESLISMRVAGIMAANKRNYYAECAGFIAAFGETRESRGIKGAKASVMEGYKQEYPRRRAFLRELSAYGMK